MAGFAVVDAADDFTGRGGAEIKEIAEGFGAEMGLVAQGDNEVGEGGIFCSPTGGGDDGAHHAAFRGKGGGALAEGNFQAVEFRDDGGRFFLWMDDEDFFGTCFRPLLEEMAEDGSLFPREAELGFAHATGFPRGEDGDESGGHRRDLLSILIIVI